MEDLFYLTPAAVTLECLEKAALEFPGLRCSYFQTDYLILRVHYPGGFWEFSHWDDLGSLEAPNLEVWNSNQPAASFLISYHCRSLPILKPFIRHLLGRWGGVVFDDDDWTTAYSLGNLHELGAEDSGT